VNRSTIVSKGIASPFASLRVTMTTRAGQQGFAYQYCAEVYRLPFSSIISGMIINSIFKSENILQGFSNRI
jgi:hypothetical protein